MPMAALQLLTFVSALAIALCADYTVTDEAWFDVEIKDHYGDGEDFRGRFVIALFGDSAPMTVLNFRHIVKGYKRGTVSMHYSNFLRKQRHTHKSSSLNTLRCQANYMVICDSGTCKTTIYSHFLNLLYFTDDLTLG